MDVSDLTYALMSERVGDNFELHIDDGRVFDFKLIEVDELTGDPGPERDGGFSSLFRGPKEPVLNQSILPLRHAEWGTLHLFLVPVGQSDAGTVYEAIVN